MILSSSLIESTDQNISKWVVPDVSGSANTHELLSEESIARVRKMAREQGYAEGLEAGKQAGSELVKSRVELFESVTAHLMQPLGQLEPEILDAMVELSLCVGREVIQRELTVDRSLVLEAVRSALDLVLSTATSTRIRVNPTDVELVQAAYADLTNREPIEFTADSNIERGGAVVEFGSSVIDAQPGSRLRKTLEALLNTQSSNGS